MTFREKVSQGTLRKRNSATLHNEMLQAANAGTQLVYGNNQPFQPNQSMYQPRAWTGWIKNNTGAALNTLDVVGLDDPVIPGETNKWEFVKNFAINASSPDEAKHAGNFAITMQPIRNGGIGRACFAGLSAVIVNILNLNDQFATVATGDSARLVSSSSDGFRIITKPDSLGDQYCIVDLGSGGGGALVNAIEFTLNADLSELDPSVAATVTVVWSGPANVSDIVQVHNTCQMFAGSAGTCGVALWNAGDSQYQIVQLHCDSPASQEANFDASLGDSITYAGTPTPIPYGRLTSASQGDLVTLEADGSFTFNRATRSGAVDISLSAVIGDVTGIGSDGDKSIFQMEYDNLGGGGWQTLETAAAIGHPYFRVPPTNYGMGGTTFARWTFDTTATAGHKLRVVVSTANGNSVSTEFIQSLFRVEEV